MNAPRTHSDCRLLSTDQEGRRLSLINQFEDVANRALNGIVTPILQSRCRWLLQPFIATITYTGRRSGATFSTPVMYRRHGEVVSIRVAAPKAKQWWRNFLDTGGPIAISWGYSTHTGHALAHRDHRGRVDVRIILDHLPPP